MAASLGIVFMWLLVFSHSKSNFPNQTASGSAVLFLFIIFNFKKPVSELVEAHFPHVIIDDATAAASLHLSVPSAASPQEKKKEKENFWCCSSLTAETACRCGVAGNAAAPAVINLMASHWCSHMTETHLDAADSDPEAQCALAPTCSLALRWLPD